MVLAEVIFQELLVDLLDDGEQTVVGGVEGQLRVGVPRRGTPALPNRRQASASRI